MMYECALIIVTDVFIINLVKFGEPKKTTLCVCVFSLQKRSVFCGYKALALWICGLCLDLQGNLKVLQHIRSPPVHRGPGTFGEHVGRMT